MSGVSTVISTAYSAGPDSIADMPARSDALIPSAQSLATTGRAGLGTSTIAAPNTTTMSSHPPPSKADTAERSHCPPPASTFGLPYRVPAPAASTTPPT